MRLQRLSLAALILGGVCFLLPFTELSCQGRRLDTFTGVHLITGRTVELPDQAGRTKVYKVSPDPAVIVVLVCGFLGGLANLKPGRVGALLSAIATLGGLVALAQFRAYVDRIDVQTLRQSFGLATMRPAPGFWLVGVFYAASLALSVVAALQPRGKPTSLP